MKNTEYPVVLFDGVCNLCVGSVQFLIRLDRHKKLRYSSLQSEFGKAVLNRQRLSDEHYDTFILLEGDKTYQFSTAAIRTFQLLGGAYSLVGIFWIVPEFIRDAIYKWVANNRYKWFGKKEECWLPSKELNSLFIDGRGDG